MALISRVGAGIFGTIFVLTVFANSISVYRRSRSNKALDDIVDALKERAHKQSKSFEKEYSLSVDEARLKMEQLGTGLHALVRIIGSAIPTDFMTEDESVSKKKNR